MHLFTYRHWNFIALIFILLIYLTVLRLTPQAVFWSADEGAKFMQLQTLLGWQGGTRYQVPYPGQRLDPTYQFYPQHPIYPQPLADGQVRFHWPIWFPFLTVLPFKLLGLPGLYLIPLVSGILTVSLSAGITYRLIPQTLKAGQAAGLLTIGMVGLASPIFFYSLLFWEHTLVVLIGVAALWLVVGLNQTKTLYKWPVLIGIGVLLISAIALRLEMIFYALALVSAGGLAFLIHQRSGVTRMVFSRWRKWLGVGGLIMVGLSLTIALDLPTLLAERGFIGPRLQLLIETGLYFLQNFDFWFNSPVYWRETWINSPASSGPELPLSLAWSGLAGVILGGVAPAVPVRARAWLLGGSGLLIGLVSLYTLFSPLRYRTLHGFFLPAPYLVFTFLSLAYARRARSFAVTLCIATTFLYLIFGTFGVMLRQADTLANLEWGPRYLLMLYPLAGICTAVGLYHFYQTTSASWAKWLLLGLAGFLLLLGIGYEIRGVREVQTTKEDLLPYAEALSRTQQPVVTDLVWLPAVLTVNFVEQDIYILAHREALYTWLTLAVENQEDLFVFAGFFLLDPGFIEEAPVLIVPTGSGMVKGITFTEFKIVASPSSQLKVH